MALLTEKDLAYTTPEDICAHLGDDYARFEGSVSTPIFQTSLFVRHTPENGVPESDNVYTRSSNPTIETAERKIAALEGGDGALCFGSGMAAISAAILHLVRAGSHVVMVGTAYGPTRVLVNDYLGKRFGVTMTAVRGDDLSEIEAAIRPETTLIYLESPSSAILRMQDLDAVAALAKAHGISTAIDNTYATPLNQQPLRHGIDVVCHTASKYLGGHSDIVAGALIANREHILRIQHEERDLLGGIMDPHQAFLLTRGLRTLPIRLRQHHESAKKVVAYLESNPKVRRVFYPGSPTYEQNELYHRYMTGGNGLVSFIPEGTPEQVLSFTHGLRLFQTGCSWGGYESLVVPYTVGMDEQEAKRQGTLAGVVRIHVGLESVDALLADLEQAFHRIPG